MAGRFHRNRFEPAEESGFWAGVAFCATEAASPLWESGIRTQDTGIVHYAEYEELPGKKIWSWGSDPDGIDWRKTLSDNNSAYMEVQGGLVPQPGDLRVP